MSEHVLLALAGILVLGIAIQWLAWYVRLPAVLLLLAGGFLAGPVTGFLDPQKLLGELLLPIVSLCVGLILFEGGLNLRFRELHETWRSLLGLLTIGVAITWIGATSLAIWVIGASLPVACILGAVLVVTGPTVIGPLLREIRPNSRVGAVAKWEGIVIDPIGATLAVLVFEAISSSSHAQVGSATLFGLGTTIVVGACVGLVAAALLIVALRRFWLPDHLHNPVTLMFVIAAFATANTIQHEAGLLAVTILGVALANQRQVPIQKIVEFKESLTILMISTLFVLLSSRISLAAINGVGWRAFAFALSLVLIVRPLSVWIATIGSGLSIRERCFLSWFAPRGIVAAAVSSVFGLRLGDEGALLAPTTLVVVFVTVAIYGLTSGPVARWLGLASTEANGLLIAGANQTARAIASVLAAEGFSVVLIDNRYARIRKAHEAGLDARFSNVLSERVLDDVNFEGIGKFLGLTSNDEVNALAAARFRELFGRENVFRLEKGEVHHARHEIEWKHHFTGRSMFATELTYEWLDSALSAGAQLKVTRLTDKFTYEDLLAHYHNRMWPLFLIDGEKLMVFSPDLALAPKAGQSVVSLVEAEASESVVQ